MISNTKIKELSVYKQQKHCEEEQVFVVEGVKMCNEILTAKVPVKVICATLLWLSQHPDLPPMAEVYEVSAEALQRISGQKTPNQVWMLIERAAVPIEKPSPATPALTLALDGLQDPGNLGTIIRTADWFGVRTIVCGTGTASCFNPKVVQSTMGSLLRTRMVYTPLPDWLASCGVPVLGAVLDGEDLFSSASLPLSTDSRAVLVVGNESRGISPDVRQYITHPVTIPNVGGTAESLNAGVACAILLAELLGRGRLYT